MKTTLTTALLCIASLVLSLDHNPRSVNAAEPTSFFFSESFEDPRLLQRGWYDGDQFTIAAKDAHTGAGCLEFRWEDRGTTPANSHGMRRVFEPSETVHLRFHMKLSKGWGWTGRGYHPHLIQFMTTENAAYHGPAGSHLTVYVEPWEGRLRLAAQDMQNKDQPHGLTQGALRGGWNGQMFDSAEKLFTDDRWHCIEAMFQLNTLDLKADTSRTPTASSARGLTASWWWTAPTRGKFLTEWKGPLLGHPYGVSVSADGRVVNRFGTEPGGVPARPRPRGGEGRRGVCGGRDGRAGAEVCAADATAA